MIHNDFKSTFVGKTLKEGNFIKASKEAKICLNCTLSFCKPEHCKRYKEEKQKLKS